jgi:predicted dithiol-disulfide oxidoreductase (DUF899 family)
MPGIRRSAILSRPASSHCAAAERCPGTSVDWGTTGIPGVQDVRRGGHAALAEQLVAHAVERGDHDRVGGPGRRWILGQPRLFDGRSQLLAYNIMFGPDYELGACPGCSSLGDELDSTRVHLNHRDVTVICFSRAPIDRLNAYKERMGWQFPYVSTYETEFPFDFGLALTPEQAQEIPEVKAMIDNPPEWLQDWGRQVGAKLEDGLREGPSFIAFARENGTVYHTYTVMAPDPFVAPYHSFLLDRTPKAESEEPRAWRKDEYPD